jgi:hypothetical protein
MADQIRFGNFNRNFPIINGKDLEDSVKADQAIAALLVSLPKLLS